MKLFGRIAQSSGASRQVEATASSYRAAETLIHQQVHPDESLLFVWATAIGTSPDSRAPSPRPAVPPTRDPLARIDGSPSPRYR